MNAVNVSMSCPPSLPGGQFAIMQLNLLLRCSLYFYSLFPQMPLTCGSYIWLLCMSFQLTIWLPICTPLKMPLDYNHGEFPCDLNLLHWDSLGEYHSHFPIQFQALFFPIPKLLTPVGQWIKPEFASQFNIIICELPDWTTLSKGTGSLGHRCNSSRAGSEKWSVLSVKFILSDGTLSVCL